jgi:hypothetical protein
LTAFFLSIIPPFSDIKAWLLIKGTRMRGNFCLINLRTESIGKTKTSQKLTRKNFPKKTMTSTSSKKEKGSLMTKKRQNLFPKRKIKRTISSKMQLKISKRYC